MLENEGVRSTIDDILPDYEPIIKAPGLAELARRATRMGVEIEVVLERVREKLYKSVDNASGGIYLITNPASWLHTPTGLVRPAPQYQCSITEARRGGSPVKSRKTGSTREAF